MPSTRTPKGAAKRVSAHAPREPRMERVPLGNHEIPASKRMPSSSREGRLKLIDRARMEAAAITMGRSAEALVGYLSRLDALRDAELGREALAERAAEAELHTRVLLSTGMDALNELNDLGLLNAVPTKKDLDAFNEMTLSEALEQLANQFRDRMPRERWDWLENAGQLVRDVEMRVESEKGLLRGTVTHSGQSRVVRFDPAAPTMNRVSTRAFFSPGRDRVYVPTSAILSSRNDRSGTVAPYDAAIAGMACVREWVYRHARNAAELGPPVRSGGGPVLVIVAIVLFVAAIVATVAAAVLAIICVGGSEKACTLAAYFGLAASVLNGAADKADANSGQQRVLSFRTNPQ